MNFLEACEKIKNEKNKKAKFIQGYETIVANSKRSLNILERLNIKKTPEAKKREFNKKFNEMMNNPECELYQECIDKIKTYKRFNPVRYKMFEVLMESAFKDIID